MVSWLDIPEHSDFSLYNIPFGIFKAEGIGPRVATRIGDYVIDLYELYKSGLLKVNGLDGEVFNNKFLNDFIALGKPVTNQVRLEMQIIFRETNYKLIDKSLKNKILYNVSSVQMMMPVKVGDYTDFYSSIDHATNVGSMFRPDNPLLPNWIHLPVAYHGRASSIVASGHPVKRPKGQFKPADSELPTFGPSRMLDFELEISFIIGKNSQLGDAINIQQAEEYIFGFVLFNDWSARDIQSWEYQPLGPFLSKNFLSSVSPWVVTLEALEPFRVRGEEPKVPLQEYLKTSDRKNFDIELEVYLHKEGLEPQRITQSNFKYMYWNICQQLAHHTVNGCNVNIGDMIASGTISGPEKKSRGCMLELTWRGKEPIYLSDGSERKFLEDGDTVIMKGFAEREGMRVGFGEVSGKVV